MLINIKTSIPNGETHDIWNHQFDKGIVTTPGNIKFGENSKLRNGGPGTGMNGTFFNRQTGVTSSIMFDSMRTIGYGVSTHYWVQPDQHPNQAGKPESVLYWDGDKFGWVRAHTVADVPSCIWAIGGAGLSDNIYNPAAEGFTGPFRDVWRYTAHGVIACKDDLVYLLYLIMSRAYMRMYCRMCGFDYAVLLDGGSPATISTKKFGFGPRWYSVNTIELIDE